MTRSMTGLSMYTIYIGARNIQSSIILLEVDKCFLKAAFTSSLSLHCKFRHNIVRQIRHVVVASVINISNNSDKILNFFKGYG